MLFVTLVIKDVWLSGKHRIKAEGKQATLSILGVKSLYFYSSQSHLHKALVENKGWRRAALGSGDLDTAVIPSRSRHHQPTPALSQPLSTLGPTAWLLPPSLDHCLPPSPSCLITLSSSGEMVTRPSPRTERHRDASDCHSMEFPPINWGRNKRYYYEGTDLFKLPWARNGIIWKVHMRRSRGTAKPTLEGRASLSLRHTAAVLFPPLPLPLFSAFLPHPFCTGTHRTGVYMTSHFQGPSPNEKFFSIS